MRLEALFVIWKCNGRSRSSNDYPSLLRADAGLPITYFLFEDARAIRGQIKNRLGIELPTMEWVVFSQAFWELIARRLIFVGGDRTFSNCRVLLTERGQRAADGEEFNPDHPARYMERLLAAAPWNI